MYRTKMLLSKLFQFVMFITSKYAIDESHGLSHSMNTLYYANQIFESEIEKKARIENPRTFGLCFHSRP